MTLKYSQATQQGQLPSSKAKAAGVTTSEILKRGFWSKESTFEKIYHKEITPEYANFQKPVLRSYENLNGIHFRA